MCGIVGFVNVDKSADLSRQKWAKMALLVDQIRGSHATGVMTVSKKGSEVSVYKRALCASDFLQLNSTEAIMFDLDIDRVFVGHNRYATQGDAHSDSGAHPFSYGDISLVHNGTLRNKRGLSSSYIDIDSEAITDELSRTSPSNYTKVLEKLDGAYTLVWVNEKTKSLYFARNEERPLFKALSADNKTLFFASEAPMITWLLGRCNPTIKAEEPKEVPVGVLHSVDFSLNKIKVDTSEFDVYKNLQQSMGLYSDYMYPTYNSTSKYKEGQEIYLNNWEFTKKNNKEWSLSGADESDKGNRVHIVSLPNSIKNRIQKEIREWKKEKNVDILLTGIIKHSHPLANGLHYTTVDPESLEVEAFESMEEDKEEKKPIVGITKEEIPIYGDWKDWAEGTSNGCASCGRMLTVSDEEDMKWVHTNWNNTSIPICGNCSTTKVNKQ